MKRFTIFILTAALALSTSAFAAPAASSETASADIYQSGGTAVKAFSDVTNQSWFYESVTRAAELGFVNGYGDGTYRPNEPVTRAEICRILYNFKGDGATAITNFSDVKPENWFYTPVSWAVSRGLISGRTDGSFGPSESLTRERLVYSLYELAGAPETDAAVLEAFTDSGTITEICLNAFAWAVANGIVNGMTETTLEPSGTATRAEVAAVMVRCADKMNVGEVPEADSETLNAES